MVPNVAVRFEFFLLIPYSTNEEEWLFAVWETPLYFWGNRIKPVFFNQHAWKRILCYTVNLITLVGFLWPRTCVVIHWLGAVWHCADILCHSHLLSSLSLCIAFQKRMLRKANPGFFARGCSELPGFHRKCVYPCYFCSCLDVCQVHPRI